MKHSANTKVTTLLLICLLAIPACAGRVFDDFEKHATPEVGKQACALARWAVECHFKGKDAKKPPFKLHRLFSSSAGVFVTLTKNGNPRGCMGTIEPRNSTVSREIIDNAVRAAFGDIRQRPLAPHELSEVTFTVAIMGPLRPVRDISQLAPGYYGLLVRDGMRSGILLPGEARTAAWQIKECKRKAGIPPKARVRMYIFRTVTFTERRSD